MPLPPVSSGKLSSPRSASRSRTRTPLLHLAEVEADVGIEVEHQPVGAFDLVDLAAPAVELDRPHLHAGEQAPDVVEVEVVLGLAVLLLDRDVLHVLAERALVVLLEEAVARPAAGTADQGHRPVAAPSTMISGSIVA